MSTSGAPLDYDKKVALITGSTGGIGQQTALLLAKNGASVILHGNSETEADVRYFALNLHKSLKF